MQALQQSEVFAEGLARIGAPVQRNCPEGPVVLRRFGLGFSSRVRAGQSGIPALVNADCAADAPVWRRLGYRQILTPAHVAELDAGPDTDVLHKGLAPPWRRALAKAKAPGLARQRFDPARHGWVLEREAEQRRARRYRAWPLGLTVAMAEAEPRAVSVWSSRQDAAVVFIRHGPAATYHIGWTGAEGRKRDSHRALLWRAVLDLKAEGVRLIDLGHVDSVSSPGLAAYKAGTGARVRPLGGTWLRIPGLGRGAKAGAIAGAEEDHHP